MIEEPIVLAYKGNHSIRGDMGDVELNCTIDGIHRFKIYLRLFFLPPNFFKNSLKTAAG